MISGFYFSDTYVLIHIFYQTSVPVTRRSKASDGWYIKDSKKFKYILPQTTPQTTPQTPNVNIPSNLPSYFVCTFWMGDLVIQEDIVENEAWTRTRGDVDNDADKVHDLQVVIDGVASNIS